MENMAGTKGEWGRGSKDHPLLPITGSATERQVIAQVYNSTQKAKLRMQIL